MSNLALLVVCLLAGIGLRKTGKLPDNTASALNGFIIYISIPALALFHIHTLKMSSSLALTALMAWILFGLGCMFFYVLGRKLKFERSTIGALMLVGGLGNTSFVGLPMIEAYYGSEFIGVGIVADLAGSFFVLSTLGILVATTFSTVSVNFSETIKKILTFPPFIALIAALLLRPFPFHEWLDFILVKLGGTLTPLALVSVGFQLRFNQARGLIKPLALGLSFKLILGPAIITLIFVGFLCSNGPTMQVTIFEAAMGPMISAGIVAVEHKLNPALVSLMLGIGVPISFLTLPVWYWLLQGV